jgi:hypothetical protein
LGGQGFQQGLGLSQVDDAAAVDGLGHLGDFHRTVASGFMRKCFLSTA